MAYSMRFFRIVYIVAGPVFCLASEGGRGI